MQRTIIHLLHYRNLLNTFINRDMVVSTGWVVISIVAIIALLSKMQKYFKQFIKYSTPNHKKTFSSKYKKILNIHCLLGLISLIPLSIHIYNNLFNFRLTLGWATLFVYIIMIISGIFKKYFIVYFPSFRFCHGRLTILFLILAIIHIYQKLF